MCGLNQNLSTIMESVLGEGRGREWRGVDLDGTLAEYHGWKGKDVIGKPVPEMVSRVKKWLADGEVVKIMTARVARKRAGSSTHASITQWCKEHLGQALPITNEKDPLMIELWDDRAIQIIPNTGERVDGK